MSPRWGLVRVVEPVIYKHSAPLGLRSLYMMFSENEATVGYTKRAREPHPYEEHHRIPYRSESPSGTTCL